MNLLIKQNLTVEQRLQKAVSDIMMCEKYIALSGLLAVGDRSVRDDIPTACTNGRDEKYGRAFCESLNDPELRFLILHENYHKLARHLHIYHHLYYQYSFLINIPISLQHWYSYHFDIKNHQYKLNQNILLSLLV